MKFKKVSRSLLSLLMALSCFLGVANASEYTPEDWGYKVTNLSSGKKHTAKDVILFDNMYSFTMSKAGVININITLEDKEFDNDDYHACYGRILNKNTWEDSQFVTDYLSAENWICANGKTQYNTNHYLNKGTYYIDINSLIQDNKVSELNITITKKNLDNYKLKTTKFKVMRVPNRNSSYSKTIKYVDDKALPILDLYYFEAANVGYEFAGMTFYDKTTSKWLNFDEVKFKYSWSKSKKSQFMEIPYGDIFGDDVFKAGSDIVIYTKWNPKKYKITYHNNGGTGSMKSSTFTYDKKGTLRVNEFKHKTKKFTGWKAKIDYYGVATMWYYTNGKKSEWYFEGLQPKGWEKKILKNKEEVKNLTYDEHAIFNINLYAIWR